MKRDILLGGGDGGIVVWRLVGVVGSLCSKGEVTRLSGVDMAEVNGSEGVLVGVDGLEGLSFSKSERSAVAE